MNALTNQGAILLANILPTNSSLIDLDLSDNRIEHDGAAIFASKLEQNFSFKKTFGQSKRNFFFLFRDEKKKKNVSKSSRITTSEHWDRYFYSKRSITFEVKSNFFNVDVKKRRFFFFVFVFSMNFFRTF